MKANPLWLILSLEVPSDCIRDHAFQLSERITLRRYASSTGRIPSRDKPSGFGARLDDEGNFFHAGKLTRIRTLGKIFLHITTTPNSEFPSLAQSDSRKVRQSFRIPHSAFRIPHSAFRIPHSAFRIPHSDQALSTDY
jgi:hypothetical protein